MSSAAPTSPPASDATVALQWFDKAQAAFDAAVARIGVVERNFQIGPCAVRLRFAGPALLRPMTDALAHLPGIAGSADFTISLFDGASAGPLPRPEWDTHAYGARGEITGFNTPGIRTVYETFDDTLRTADLSRGRGVFWTREAAQVPYYERSAPLRTIFHWLLGQRGMQLVHSAAVGNANGAVLMAGVGGSGKSTSALTCLGSTLRYAGDDYVLLAPAAEGATIYSLYSAAKLHAEQLQRFPHLGQCVDNPAPRVDEKAVLFLAQHHPAALLPVAEAKAILLPRITHQQMTRVTRASAAAALAALAPTTMFQLPGEGRRTFEALATLVRTLPCLWLELGTELERIPDVIAQVLSR